MKKIIQNIRDYSYLKYYQPENIEYDASMDYLFKFSIAFIQFILFFIFGILAFFTPHLEFLKTYKLLIIILGSIVLLGGAYFLSKLIIAKTDNPIGTHFTNKQKLYKAIWYYVITLGFFVLTVLNAFIFGYLKNGHF